MPEHRYDSLSSLEADSVRSPALELAPRLRQVVSASVDLLEADDVGVLLIGDGDLARTVASTDHVAEALERAQAAASAGHGPDSLTSGTTVVVDDLALRGGHGPVWPRGFRAVLTTPIRVAGNVVGSFTALRREPRRWTAAQVSGSEVVAGVIGRLLELSAAAARHSALHTVGAGGE